MTRRITLLLATCMLLGLLGLVPLLAGFVPQYWGAEMRGLINPQVVSLRPEDRPRPIETQGADGRVWAVRMPVDDTPVEALDSLPSPRRVDVVRFEADGVRLALADRAFLYDGNAATALAPLLALDGFRGLHERLSAGRPGRAGRDAPSPRIRARGSGADPAPL